LTDAEFRTMREHALHTKLILSKIRFPTGMSDIPDMAAQHHERIDGSGGPWGLKGDDITLGGRIIAVADVFDALTSRRYYKEPIGFDAALATLRADAGTQFDPTVIDAFERAREEIHAIYKEHAGEILKGH